MKIGRNEPCPCGSGLKYKKCCGDPAKQNRGNLSSGHKTSIHNTPSSKSHKTIFQERYPVDLKEGEYGVITPASEFHSFKDGAISLSPFVHPQNLRYFALYWDKILLTESDMSVIHLNEDMERLKDAGLLGKYSSRVLLDLGQYNPDQIDDIYITAMSDIAFEMEKKNPGRWTIHHPDCLGLKGPNTSEMYTAKVSLLNCLPLPKEDLRLDRLLDFKMKREAELTGLRLTLGELYGNIASSNDIPHSKTTEILRLENALLDLNRSDSDGIFSRFSMMRTTVVDVGIKDVALGAAAGLFVGAQWTSDPIIGLATGAIGSVAGGLSGVKFEIDVSKQVKNSTSLDLSYINAAKKADVIDE